MGLQGAVATLPLLQGRGGSCFIQEPSKAATGSVLGATSASDTATPRPSEPDPDPAPPSPLCHFGCLWFQAHGEVAAKALNRCQGRRAGGRHTLRTLPTPRSCPTRGFSSHPSTSPSGWGAPGTPRFLQQPRATGFGTRKGPGKLQVSSTAPKKLPSKLVGWEKRGPTARAWGWGFGEDPKPPQRLHRTPRPRTPQAPGWASLLPPVAHLSRKRNPKS